MESIKRNLKGKGKFSVKDGKITYAQISSGLLRFLGLQDLREIAMDKAEGAFRVSDGVISLTSLITSKDLILDETGTISMDEKLDLGVMVKVSEKLSPKMLSQSSISQFLSEEKGWTSIPLRISGMITKPSYAIDMKHVGRKASERLKRRAEEEIFRTLSGDKEKKQGISSGQEKAAALKIC